MNWDLILNEYLAWSIAAIAGFSFLAVAAWSKARREEREAFYKSEAIKKLAEMQGKPDESVLQLLREALAPKGPSPAMMGPIQAQAYYRNETLKKIAETRGSESLLEFLREDQKKSARRQREGMKLGGLICAGVGISLLIFLRQIVPDQPVYLAGMIPLLVGAALLTYAFFMTPQE
ncbi:MAG: hypothetical protein LAP40_20625 [Acidobacteriia bacterium]|nr:hypothetical protein [Terriglobia bacterium]